MLGLHSTQNRLAFARAAGILQEDAPDKNHLHAGRVTEDRKILSQ